MDPTHDLLAIESTQVDSNDSRRSALSKMVIRREFESIRVYNACMVAIVHQGGFRWFQYPSSGTCLL